MDALNGKAIKEIIDWWFDEENSDNRQEISKFKMTNDEVVSDYQIALAMHHLPTEIAKKKIAHTAVAKKYKAIMPPNFCIEANKIFNFLRSNENLTTERSGIEGYSTGLDNSKFKAICRDYELDFFVIKDFIRYYQNKLIEKQNREFERRSKKS